MTSLKASVFTDKKTVRRYVLIIGASLIAVCLILAVLSSLIPSNIGKLDLTSNKMFTLGDISRETAMAASQDVTIYLISEEGNESSSVETIINRYTKLNPKIKFDTLNPTKDEDFISKYHSSVIEDGSVLILCGERAKYIPYSSFFSYSSDNYDYCYQLYTYYYQYGYISSDVTFADFMQHFAPSLTLYDGYEYELHITSALKSLTSDDCKKIYILSGHNEYGLSQDTENRLRASLLDMQTLNLSESAIPHDAKCILLTPAKDITENEYTALSEYLKNGGRLMLLTSYSDSVKFENLLKLTGDFGLSTSFDGYLCEDDKNYNLNSYQGLTVPDISSSDLADILEANSASVLLGGATGITATETNGITHTPLFTTSPSAYEKHLTDDSDSLDFNEETDTRGTFYTGIKAENSSSGELIWISSEAIIYDDFDPYCSRGNKEAFIHLLNDLTDNTGALNIETKAVSTEIIDADSAYIYTVLAIFALLALGSLTFGIIRYRKTR